MWINPAGKNAKPLKDWRDRWQESHSRYCHLTGALEYVRQRIPAVPWLQFTFQLEVLWDMMWHLTCSQSPNRVLLRKTSSFDETTQTRLFQRQRERPWTRCSARMPSAIGWKPI